MDVSKHRQLISTLIAIVVAFAGALGGLVWIDSLPQPSTPPNLTSDGPTFHQALNQTNVSVANATGGPWLLFSAIGLASQGALDPSAFGFASTNASLKYCGAEFNGLTIWNGSSIPIFTGGIASGTAPFWQFAFYSNNSQQIIVATDVSGIPHVYPPMSMSSPCASYSGLGAGAQSYVDWLNPLPIDTSAMALPAYDAIGREFEASHGPILEIFNFGYSLLNQLNHGGNGVGLVVEYARCGLVGAGGLQPNGIVGETSNGAIADTDIGTVSCTWVDSSSPLVYGIYQLEFGGANAITGLESGSIGVNFTFQVEIPPANTSVLRDGWGLVSWMSNLTLRDSSNRLLRSAPASCQAWVPSLSACSTDTSGWSAVLLSANGMWMDTYPSEYNWSSWAIPNVPIVSQEQLVILVPTSFALTADTISFSNTATVPVVIGTGTL
jgi:hypothetical protein